MVSSKLNCCILIAIMLFYPAHSQLSQLVINSDSVLPDLGKGLDSLKTALPAIIDKAAAIVIKEEKEDIPIIDNNYRDLCKSLLVRTNFSGLTAAKINGLVHKICDFIILGTGDILKNRFLAFKMMKYVTTASKAKSWDLKLPETYLTQTAMAVNNDLKKDLNKYREVCWGREDNCDFTQEQKGYQQVQLKWQKVRNEGYRYMKEYFQKVENSQADGSNPLGRRMLEILAMDLSFLKHIYFLQFKILNFLREVNERISEIARSGESSRQKFTNLLNNFSLDKAMARCQLKYKDFGECKKIDSLTVCFGCTAGFESYRRESGNCGCKNANQVDYAKKREECYKLTNLDHRAVCLLLNGIGKFNVEVDDAFYFQVEDMYN